MTNQSNCLSLDEDFIIVEHDNHIWQIEQDEFSRDIKSCVICGVGLYE